METWYRIEWPNGLGYDLIRGDGAEWSFFRPEYSNREVWGANFYPPEAIVATLHGEGLTAEAAQQSAQPIN